jgi:hypothetical protein
MTLETRNQETFTSVPEIVDSGFDGESTFVVIDDEPPVKADLSQTRRSEIATRFNLLTQKEILRNRDFKLVNSWDTNSVRQTSQNYFRIKEKILNIKTKLTSYSEKNNSNSNQSLGQKLEIQRKIINLRQELSKLEDELGKINPSTLQLIGALNRVSEYDTINDDTDLDTLPGFDITTTDEKLPDAEVSQRALETVTALNELKSRNRGVKTVGTFDSGTKTNPWDANNTNYTLN